MYAPVEGGDPDAVPRVSTVLDRVEAWGPCVDTLTVLQGFDPAGLSPFDQVTYLCLVDAHVGWLEGMKQRAVLAVAGCRPGTLMTRAEKRSRWRSGCPRRRRSDGSTPPAPWPGSRPSPGRPKTAGG